jgi:hypothetical protein
MTQLFANNIVTEVATGINASATSLVLDDASSMPSPTGGDYFLLTLFSKNASGKEDTWEILKVTARSSNTVTIVRAQEGTSAATWAAETPCEMRATGATFGAKQDTIAYTTENTANKGAASGYASLGSDSKVPASQLPALAITNTTVVSSQSAQLALTAEVGDMAIRSDLSKSFVLRVSPATTFSNWSELLAPTDAVISVNGNTGSVSLTTANVADSTDKRYVTDAGLVILGNASGTNTGDNAGVTAVSVTAPIATSGGVTPTISIAAATASIPGSMSAADKTKLNAISGTNTGDQTTITGNAGTATLAANVTTNANLTGHITSTGNAAVLGSFTSAELAAALTNETGTGSVVFDNNPLLVTPNIGTPSAGTLTNCTFPTLNQDTTGSAGSVTTNANLTGHVTSVGNAAVLGSFTSAQLVTALSDDLVVPVLKASNGLVVQSATISASYSIPSGSNAMSVGPVSVATGQTITVPTGNRWVII